MNNKKAHEERKPKSKAKAVEVEESDSNSIVNTQYPDDEYSSKVNDFNADQPHSEQIDFVSKLQLEVQLMLRLEHPNIVTVYQVINSEEECFIIM